MGRFNMGSTVILLFPENSIEWSPSFVPGRIVRMGETLGHRRPS
jgi:phosphatidylserine decarboxylase